MSTDIAKIKSDDNAEIQVNQFFGGKDRGIMLQITQDNGYVELKKSDVQKMIPIITNWLLILTEKEINSIYEKAQELCSMLENI